MAAAVGARSLLVMNSHQPTLAGSLSDERQESERCASERAHTYQMPVVRETPPPDRTDDMADIDW
jgi:hypothetical protein